MRFIPLLFITTVSIATLVVQPSLSLDDAVNNALLFDDRRNDDAEAISDVLRFLRGVDEEVGGKPFEKIKKNPRSGVINGIATNGGNPRSKRRRRTQRGNVRYRIIGGTDVKSQDDYPFFAELAMGCGASLISENVLLTAAHCLSESVRLDHNVWVGSHGTEDGVHRKFDGVAIHPDYGRLAGGSKNDLRYDFALLSLEEPIIGVVVGGGSSGSSGSSGISDNDHNRNDGRNDYYDGNNAAAAAAAVRLNRIGTHPSEPDATLTVIGFGQTTYHGHTANRLQELEVPFVPHEACAEIYAGPNAGVTIDERSMLCAGGTKDKDSCLGDSGGPILDSDGVQVGVVSFGASCGDEGWPGVYSRVSGAIDWIDDFVCANSPSVDRMPETCRSNNDQRQRFRVQLEIDHDNDATQEISWNINSRDTGNNVITVPRVNINNNGDTTTGTTSAIRVPRAGFQNNNNSNDGKYTRGMNLVPGRYSFQIEDSEGKGILGGTNRNYRLTTATAAAGTTTATTIERDGRFGYHDFVDFEITDSGELLNNLLPYYGDQNRIRIDIMYDEYPSETAWALINRDTKKHIHVSKRGTVVSPGLVSVPLEVPDGNYWLLMVDSAGDGICCDYGRGSIEITRIVDGADFELASHRGMFQSVVDMDFTVP